VAKLPFGGGYTGEHIDAYADPKPLLEEFQACLLEGTLPRAELAEWLFDAFVDERLKWIAKSKELNRRSAIRPGDCRIDVDIKSMSQFVQLKELLITAEVPPPELARWLIEALVDGCLTVLRRRGVRPKDSSDNQLALLMELGPALRARHAERLARKKLPKKARPALVYAKSVKQTIKDLARKHGVSVTAERVAGSKPGSLPARSWITSPTTCTTARCSSMSPTSARPR
jgi:hypothetical protein